MIDTAYQQWAHLTWHGEALDHWHVGVTALDKDDVRTEDVRRLMDHPVYRLLDLPRDAIIAVPVTHSLRLSLMTLATTRAAWIVQGEAELGPQRRCRVCFEWWPLKAEFWIADPYSKRDTARLQPCRSCRHALGMRTHG